MAVIADIVIVAVILAALFLGARQGLLQSLAGLIVVVAAFFGAAWLARMLADPVAQWLQPLLEQKLSEHLQGQSASAASADEMLSVFGFSGQSLVELAQNVTRQALETGRTLLETVVGSVIHSVAYAVVYLVSFILLLIVLTLLIKPLELATKLPGLRTLNGLGGALLGFIKGVLLVYLLVWGLQKLQLVITPQLVEESMLLPIFVNNTPISLITSL
ncbi:MAG: CvpA family protein [Ruminococcaceae bacterium]|jgi:uncharacterized membrane protein required for colicin V production|nr:CvpA family protein [Oscillospiraceae bacterium]